jgi:hypothetical protein
MQAEQMTGNLARGGVRPVEYDTERVEVSHR